MAISHQQSAVSKKTSCQLGLFKYYTPTANDSPSGTIVTVGWVERNIEITRLDHRKLYIVLCLNTPKHQRNPTLSLKQLHQFQIKGTLAKNCQQCTDRNNGSKAN